MNLQDLFKQYKALSDEEAKKAFLEHQNKRIQSLSSEERMIELKEISKRVDQIAQQTKEYLPVK